MPFSKQLFARCAKRVKIHQQTMIHYVNCKNQYPNNPKPQDVQYSNRQSSKSSISSITWDLQTQHRICSVQKHKFRLKITKYFLNKKSQILNKQNPDFQKVKIHKTSVIIIYFRVSYTFSAIYPTETHRMRYELASQDLSARSQRQDTLLYFI